MKYTIEIEETLSRVLEINAESESEAWEKANKLYRNSEIILSGDDFMRHEIRVLHNHGETL